MGRIAGFKNDLILDFAILTAFEAPDFIVLGWIEL